MSIMEENTESSQQPKVENVKFSIDDQIQSMKTKFSQYNVKDQKPVAACNYRVPDNLRKGNEDAYTPKVVSIGPIHHGKPQLQTMEQSKWMFLGWYLERSLVSFDDMVRVGIDIEEEARMYYLEEFDNISSPEFSEMIILDFIFLIEFLFKIVTRNDQMIPFDIYVITNIVSDTMLLENQFPQQLLAHLFHLLYTKEHKTLGDLILKYFKYSGISESHIARPNDWNSATDMLDLLVTCHVGQTDTTSIIEIERTTWLERTCSATELREAGVKFSKVVDADFLLDVKFVNGVLLMPVIAIDTLAETRFRNMIALEKSRLGKPKRVNGYINLLSSLVRSPKDVVMLTNCGIIEHPYYENEEVKRIFDDVRKGGFIDLSECYFWGLYVEMHEYGETNWHQWKGSFFKWRRLLREDYFSSPWSIISFIAAFILMLLTAIQTACTIDQTMKQK